MSTRGGGRSANGRSSIHQDAKGSWHGYVSMGRSAEGKSVRRHVRGRTRSEVTTKVEALEAERARTGRRAVDQRRLTTGDWLDEWLVIIERTRKPKTHDIYTSMIRVHAGPLADLPLSQVTVRDIDNLLHAVSATAPQSAVSLHRILRSSFNTAIKRGLLAANPCTHAVDTVAGTWSVPDVLVNNAGIPDARRAHRMPLELVDAVLATNLRGPWLLATDVARRLIEEGRPGRVVNVSSMTAFHYTGEAAALYSTTKAAVNRMTEALAVEWARHHVNVNAIAPGAFASEMMDGMIERVGDVTGGFPRRRLGAADQLTSTLLYLVSPASEAVTGTVVRVDDGQLPR